MIRNLLFEIKENQTIITVTELSETKLKILFHKVEFENDDNFEWINIDLINSLSQSGLEISDFDEISILFNSSKFYIQSEILTIGKDVDLNNLKKQIAMNLKDSNKNLILTNIVFNKIIEKDRENILFYTWESIEQKLYTKLIQQFTKVHIHISQIIPYNKTIRFGLNKKILENKSLLYFQLDENQSIISYFENSKSFFHNKKSIGYNSLLKEIKLATKVKSLEDAEKILFEYGSFSNIEKSVQIIISKLDPETKQKIIFTNKDLNDLIEKTFVKFIKLVFENIPKFINLGQIKLIINSKMMQLPNFSTFCAQQFPNIEFESVSDTEPLISKESLIQWKGSNYFLMKYSKKIIEQLKEKKIKDNEKTKLKRTGFFNFILNFFNYI